MFTGLIRDVGMITGVTRPTNKDIVFTIETKLEPRDLELGASIACDGVCLTVTSYKDNAFTVQAAAETLAVTAVGDWDVGTKINLEPSLRAGDAMGGHIVAGHVDGIAQVRKAEARGEGIEFTIAPPANLMKYIAAKGSVALRGVSLTVNALGDDWFTIHIIPHTLAHTNFGTLKAGDRMHIEIDTIARYAERLLGAR